MKTKLAINFLITFFSLAADCYKIFQNGKQTNEEKLTTDQRDYIKEQHDLFIKKRRQQAAKKEKKKDHQDRKPAPFPEGFVPSKFGILRNASDPVELTIQVLIPGGTFWFGSQMNVLNKIAPPKFSDGSKARIKTSVRDFYLDVDCVTNEQFDAFTEAANYTTESELYGWSFVLDIEASEDVIEQVDGPKGFGRVKSAKHWMAVPEAHWRKPYGGNSYISDKAKYPVTHISYRDASEYCMWAGRRLPTEKEWEYACRGGLVNRSYPWGDNYIPGRMNAWEGKFPLENTGEDGYTGVAPAKSYEPNEYGVYNLLGNVWEWVAGGTAAKRIMRGGSYIDSVDGSFNHPVIVSTRQENSGDSASSTSGFRCAYTPGGKGKTSKRLKRKQKKKSSARSKSKFRLPVEGNVEL